MKSLYEQLGDTYHFSEDGTYDPDLEVPEEETPRFGKYDRMHHTYLREHMKAYYTTQLFDESCLRRGRRNHMIRIHLPLLKNHWFPGLRKSEISSLLLQ